mmetsp:Transcript_39244/g.62149  ORF Transcript_39244/g.62149 Transcript_39244/m.62149 type:complete len:163 (-) Transcript_39244:92-580(-)
MSRYVIVLACVAGIVHSHLERRLDDVSGKNELESLGQFLLLLNSPTIKHVRRSHNGANSARLQFPYGRRSTRMDIENTEGGVPKDSDSEDVRAPNLQRSAPTNSAAQVAADLQNNFFVTKFPPILLALSLTTLILSQLGVFGTGEETTKAINDWVESLSSGS